jgi:hypothetical protein
VSEVTKKDAVARVKAHGVIVGGSAWDACHRADSRVEYAIVCAVLTQETGGGHNLFGHDPTICVGWGTVTEAKYRQYLAARKRTGQVQGVGPTQLTYGGYQDAADKLGGCWVPKNNVLIGVRILHRLLAIHKNDLVGALAGYNGSHQYGVSVAHAVRTFWRPVIAGKKPRAAQVERPGDFHVAIGAEANQDRASRVEIVDLSGYDD